MTPQTLCIPIGRDIGGGLSTFLGNFRTYLDAHALPYTDRFEDRYDVLFVNSWVVPAQTVARLKRSRPDLRVVHRMDGAAQEYGRGTESDIEQARVNVFADLTIFQSEYARAVTKKLRIVRGDGPVIYNPVDLDTFSPDGRRADLGPASVRVVNVSWSTNRVKGTWRIGQLAADHPHVQFVLCGRYDPTPAGPNIRWLGPLARRDLADVLRACDLFLDLSRNDACPNVVLEALACGLPVAHVGSGAVPELAADAGLPLEDLGMGGCVERALTTPVLRSVARARAVSTFAPKDVLRRYVDAIDGCRRNPLPTRDQIAALAARGFPVQPGARERAGSIARELWHKVPRSLQHAVRRVRASPRSGASALPRLGWVTYDSAKKTKFGQLDPFTRMRAGRIAEWLHINGSFECELYRPDRRYDIVVFQKMMDDQCQREAERVRRRGGRVVFDANVNYFEVWGDYFVSGTRPTDTQLRDAVAMTAQADWVIADSRYLERVIRPINQRVIWIPDNVPLDVYSGSRVHEERRPVRLVWSGVAKKAAHLLAIRDVLARLRGIEVVLVSDAAPEVMAELDAVVPCRFERFSDRGYAEILRQSDILISPKRLVNAYEMAHTEYKITLGMAVGLPAVASPQPSYIDAISYAGGGVIAATDAEWGDALAGLAADATRRAEVGRRAQATVRERYATTIVARQFQALFEALLGSRDALPAAVGAEAHARP